MPSVYLGVGSNTGDRSRNISNAVRELVLTRNINIIKTSTIEETAPVDYLEQPFFLNQILLIETDIRPRKLLKLVKKIEKKMGREKTIPKGPRIIDIDILLYGSYILKSEILTIPHAEIKNREFILKHLIEITPDLTDPLTKIRYSDIYNNLING